MQFNFDNCAVTAFEKRKDRQENTTNSGGCLADDCSTTISSSFKDSTATDCEGLTSSATSTPSSAFLLLKQQQLSLSDEEDKNLASTSRTMSVDDNADVVMLNTDENTTANYSTLNQAAIIKRYKIERKNSQQSSHSKIVSNYLFKW